jgi:hypothetical protein
MNLKQFKEYNYITRDTLKTYQVFYNIQLNTLPPDHEKYGKYEHLLICVESMLDFIEETNGLIDNKYGNN